MMMNGENNLDRQPAAYEPPRLERVGSLLNLLGKTGVTFELGGDKRAEPPPPGLGGGGPIGFGQEGGDGHGHGGPSGHGR